MKIKIKVKHLVLYVLIPVFLLTAAALWIPGAVDRYQASQTPEAIRARMLEKIEAASGADKLERIAEFAVLPSAYEPYTFDVRLGPRVMMQSDEDNPAPLTPEDRVPLLELYVGSGPPGDTLLRAANQLAYEYDALGQAEQATRMLERTADRLDLDEHADGQKLRQELAKREPPTQTPGKTPAASTFSGRLIDRDGSPVRRAGIYLLGEEGSDSAERNDPYQAVTDPNGNFEILNVAPGFYQIELGLDYEQVDGRSRPVQWDDWIEIKQGRNLSKNLTLRPLIELQSPVNGQKLTEDTVEFRWTPVQGAAYYDITGFIPDENGLSGTGTVIRSRIPENRLSLSIEELYAAPGASTLPDSGKWEDVDPNYLLAYMNPNARFSWLVRAYDAEGRALSESSGYRLNPEQTNNLPFFYLKQRELSGTDRLLLKGRLSQAFEQYRQEAESDPRNIHALRMTARLMLSNVEISHDALAKKELLPLLERLTAGVSSPQEVERMLNLLYEEADWDAYEHYYERYTRLNGGQVEPYLRSLHAASLFYRGRAGEAVQEFEQTLPDDPGHRFVGLYLAAQLQEGRTLGEALELARRYPELGYEQGGRGWTKLLNTMLSERSAAGSAADFDTRLRTSLGEFAQNRAADPLASLPPTPTGSASIDAFVKALTNIR
ncbi:hypothetical protein [Saccharibacillus qingshengii]|uniref:hypothetical protein n=1 Tax=Saccharibacillus qingshengii TaxID=1763540 RepID=UPI001556ED03|nr:hypothetical protein [Saccharibacillus qingshengii]